MLLVPRRSLSLIHSVMNPEPRSLELLAPARDADTAIAAIIHGADAVYMGAEAFSARSAATNSLDDIARVVEYAHRFGVKIYVAFNTILYNEELDRAAELVTKLYNIGVDALIVQDAALLALDLPPIDIHASTQWNVFDIQGFEHLAQAGFSQIVVPREFDIKQIRQVAKALPNVVIEAFVHGALCVSRSGGCYAGQILAGRSANRGDCPQVCRLAFNLVDKNGRRIATPDGGSSRRHWLSLADMNRLDYLADLADAGVRSFKIEGRLKPISYVKNITAAYSQALNALVEQSNGRYKRASFGNVKPSFRPDPVRSFNRGFTNYFSTNNITSWASPKWIGEPVAQVVKQVDNYLVIKASRPLHNGDGVGWFDQSGEFCGFGVNRIDGNRLYPPSGANIPHERGVVLYRNKDIEFESLLSRPDSAVRTIRVSFNVHQLSDGRVRLIASDERGMTATAVSEQNFTEIAHSDQTENRKTQLSKLGNTIYRLDNLSDSLNNIFVPSSVLSSLRRKVVETLDDAMIRSYKRNLRRADSLQKDALKNITLSYQNNIANDTALQYFASHGANVGSRPLAAEVDTPSGETLVMTTRYCIRKALGACLKTANASKLPKDLYLFAPIGTLRLHCDCSACRMLITTMTKSTSNDK